MFCTFIYYLHILYWLVLNLFKNYVILGDASVILKIKLMYNSKPILVA